MKYMTQILKKHCIQTPDDHDAGILVGRNRLRYEQIHRVGSDRVGLKMVVSYRVGFGL